MSHFIRMSGGSEPIRCGEPNPHLFKIEKCVKTDDYAALFVKYPNCTNYEGNKVLIIRDVRLIDEKEIPQFFVKLDPHFLEGGRVVARFEPTDDGWNLATMISFNLGYNSKLKFVGEVFFGRNDNE